MDRLVRVLCKRRGQVITDDKHEDYNYDKDYLIEEESLENGMTVLFYYEQDNE